MPTCELLTIGSELLNGSTLNTNAQFLAKRVSELDIEVTHQASCRDREQDILSALSLAHGRSDLILVTGGLGSTPDDITREAIAKFFRCELKFDRAQYRRMVHYFRTIHKTAPFLTRREAFLPEVAKPLLNRFGFALGFYVAQNGKLLIVLPGVPQELIKMYELRVSKLIQQKFKGCPRSYRLEARIAGLYETEIMRKLGAQFFKGRTFEFGIYPEIGNVTIRIKTSQKGLISSLRREIREKLGRAIYSFHGESMAAVIGRELVKQRKTLAIAESCTGGLLAERITDPPGASSYFRGGVVAYSNQVKYRKLGIPAELLHRKGAVSKEVAKAMAEAVRIQCQASIGVAVTGIAGPGGGTRSKPVGLVYIGISDAEKTHGFQFRFVGDRTKVRHQAAQKALFFLREWLTER